MAGMGADPGTGMGRVAGQAMNADEAANAGMGST